MVHPSGFSGIVRDQRRNRVPEGAVIVRRGIVMAVGTPCGRSNVAVPCIVRRHKVLNPAKRSAAVFGIVVAVIARTVFARPVCAPDASV